MSLYAKIDGTQIFATRTRKAGEEANHTDVVTAKANGKCWWVPVIRNDPPAYDPSTQHKPVEIETITDDAVTYSWADPVDKTAEEIAAKVDAQKEAQLAGLDNSKGLEYALGQVLFEVVNQLRELQGKDAITAAQFRQYVKDKMLDA